MLIFSCLFGLARGTSQVSAGTYPHSSPPPLDDPNSRLLDAAEEQIRATQYAAAIATLQPLANLQPPSWRLYYDLGYALLRLKGEPGSLENNLREAITYLSRSLQLNESNADAHKALGLALTMIDREDLAGVEFAEAVRLAPGSAENHYFLGRHFMHDGQYAQAAAALRIATELDTTYTKAFENLGVTLDKLGNPENALQCLKKAVELDEESPAHSEWPYLELARFYQGHGNGSLALPLARKTVDMNPRSEEALLQLALLYRANEDWPHALDVLQHAEQLNPRDAETQYLLGRTYKALGDRAKSDSAFSRYQQLHKPTEPNPTSPPAALPGRDVGTERTAK